MWASELYSNRYRQIQREVMPAIYDRIRDRVAAPSTGADRSSLGGVRFTARGTDDRGNPVSVTWSDGELTSDPPGVAEIVRSGAGEKVPEPIPGVTFDPADGFSTACYLEQIFFPEVLRSPERPEVDGEIPEDGTPPGAVN